MSVEALKEFGKKVVEDEGLKAKAKEVGMENVEGMAKLAQDNGFDVTAEDFQAAANQAQSSGELSEDDLEKVAGGFVTASLAVAAVGAAAGAASAGAAVAGTTAGGGW